MNRSLCRHHQTGPTPHIASEGASPQTEWTGPRVARRAKIWGLSPSLHCSIIGACLTAGELRRLFVKLGDADAKSATDHEIHSRGVRAAASSDIAGRLLNKTLDDRHEAAIRRFAKAKTADEVKQLWAKAFEQGDISGPYWATLTHPACDSALVRAVFGEVHMLSHMVGSASRIDIARLAAQDRALAERDDTIARQQARLQESAREREVLARQMRVLDEAARRQPAAETRPREDEAEQRAARLSRRLAEEESLSALRQERLLNAEARAVAAERRLKELAANLADAEARVAALESLFQHDSADGTDDDALAARLRGLTLLYVGGRPSLVEQLRGFAGMRGAALLAHDGGLEDSLALLPGLVSRADAVLFPVDCVSHSAISQIKTRCQRANKPFMALHRASLASFVAYISSPHFREQTLIS
jgi:hypothetical protein